MRRIAAAIAVLAALAYPADAAAQVDLAAVDAAGPVAAGADPDAPTVGASLDRTEAYVGDRLALTVTAIARAGIGVTLPQKLELGKLELLDRDDSEAQGRDLGDGRRSFRFLLYIAAYEVGALEVPPIALSYVTTRGEVRTASTGPVPLSIRALVDEAAVDPQPQPARSPHSALIEDRRVVTAAWVLVGLVSGVLLVVLLRRLVRGRRRASAQAGGPIVPTRPPGEVAIERLVQIRARGAFGRDGYRPFAFETAEVVRAYLGARYGFDSLELTSTELVIELTRLAPHLVEPSSEVMRFIEATDLIKFANAGGSDAQALALLDAAQAIVLATAPKLEVAAEMLSGPVRPPVASSSARGEDA